MNGKIFIRMSFFGLCLRSFSQCLANSACAPSWWSAIQSKKCKRVHWRTWLARSCSSTVLLGQAHCHTAKWFPGAWKYQQIDFRSSWKWVRLHCTCLKKQESILRYNCCPLMSVPCCWDFLPLFWYKLAISSSFSSCCILWSLCQVITAIDLPFITSVFQLVQDQCRQRSFLKYFSSSVLFQYDFRSSPVSDFPFSPFKKWGE